MKKCKSCGTQSRNKTYPGDYNRFNVKHCHPCAMILYQVELIEKALSGPNSSGIVRNVKLTATITK